MLLLVLFLFINVVTLSSMIIKKISKGGTIRNNRRGGAIPKKNLCKGNLSDKKWHRKKKLCRQVS